MGRKSDGVLQFHGVHYDPMNSLTAPDKWTDGRNMYFYQGESRRVPGYGKVGGVPLFDADKVQYVNNGTQGYWVYACARAGGRIGVGVTNGVNHWDITPPGWRAITTKGFIVTMDQINNFPIINHPEVGPFWWDYVPTAKAAALPGWPVGQSCRVMRAHKGFLMAINVDGQFGLAEGTVMWSSSADAYTIPQEWVPSVTNDAGEHTISSPGGPLIDGLSVRDQFFVAKANCTSVLSYVAGNAVFMLRDVFPSMGVASVDAWAEVQNSVWQVTGDLEIVRHDGTQVQSVGYGAIQETFRNNLNAEWVGNVFMIPDLERGQVMICYPTGTSQLCDEAITIEIATGDLCLMDLPDVSDYGVGLTAVKLNAWDDDPEAWDSDITTWNQGASGYASPSVVFACGPYGLLEQGSGNGTFQGGNPIPISAFLSRSGIDLDTRLKKTFSNIWPAIRGNDGVKVVFRITGQETEGGQSTALPDLSYEIGTQSQLDFFITTRLLGLTVFTDGGPEWGMGRLQMAARAVGP